MARTRNRSQKQKRKQHLEGQDTGDVAQDEKHDRLDKADSYDATKAEKKADSVSLSTELESVEAGNKTPATPEKEEELALFVRHDIAEIPSGDDMGETTEGSDRESVDSDDLSSDEGDLANETVERKVVETMAMIRAQDPRLYERDFRVFQDDDFEDDFLTVKSKTHQELGEEDAEYERFKKQKAISRQVGEDHMMRTLLDDDENMTEKDRFLRDYILMEGWKPSSQLNALHVEPEAEDNQDLSDDDDHVVAAEEFETQYNFRFEEDEGSKVKSYPRHIDCERVEKISKKKRQADQRRLRKVDTAAARQAELAEARKVKQLEILQRLQNTHPSGPVEELLHKLSQKDADFDEEEHEKIIEALIEDDTEPSEAVANLLEELQNLEFEDIIGDVCCRYKYRDVEPDAFGLTTNDIFSMDATELEKKVPVELLHPFRDERLEATVKQQKFRKMQKKIRARREAPPKKPRKKQKIKTD
ncbi:MAG: uncharacterized protein KVP18_000736 [Porospora cf. gigantea A]|uniref:uncharacterized protein n=1 Tax=Porospora cf. gigantea A TaxID=2853593 RepID=UPI0035595258|nr:MAG: hypothetical protein KVP18_000736 [Porospora cf. gigantea A]